LTTASTQYPVPFRENRLLQWLCIAMALGIALSAYHPDEVDDWFMENTAAIVFLIVLISTYRRMPLSDTSYLCIFVFLTLHEWGAHYKYSDVPLGEWMKPWFHTTRNSYDRVIHFGYGLLCGYPLQEWCMRTGTVNGWRYGTPIAMTMAFSAAYEIVEAIMAMILTPERGEEFVGMQGDMWDAQKDMLMAGIGVLVAMGGILAIRRLRTASAKKVQPASAYVRAGR
jgi:putative membrane protein